MSDDKYAMDGDEILANLDGWIEKAGKKASDDYLDGKDDKPKFPGAAKGEGVEEPDEDGIEIRGKK